MTKRLTKHAMALVATLLASAGLQAALPQATPAESRIAAARSRIEAAPQRADAHAALAMALARRARETADPEFYEQAAVAADHALAIEPDNRDAERARIWIELGRHEFARALELATAYSAKAPDDLSGQGFLVDANVELGNYEAAERAAQWMLDLRPGNIPGLTRAAYLRELFGDTDGALDLMRMALQRTPPAETEDLAWTLTQIGHLHLSRGETDKANAALERALALFPDYHYALGAQAEVRTAQGRFAEAADLQARRYRNAPHPENLFQLAKAQERAGRRDAARTSFRAFERAALAEAGKADNSNRELVFYYAEHARDAARALAISRTELARRQDVFTLDAHAWALHRAGHHAEARRTMQRALDVGIRDAAMRYRAGAIAAAGGDRVAALARLRESLAIDAHSEVAAPAARLIAQLQARSNRIAAR